MRVWSAAAFTALYNHQPVGCGAVHARTEKILYALDLKSTVRLYMYVLDTVSKI